MGDARPGSAPLTSPHARSLSRLLADVRQALHRADGWQLLHHLAHLLPALRGRTASISSRLLQDDTFTRLLRTNASLLPVLHQALLEGLSPRDVSAHGAADLPSQLDLLPPPPQLLGGFGVAVSPLHDPHRSG